MVDVTALPLGVVLLALLVGPAALVAVLGPATVRWCRARGLVVPVDARRAHKTPTPHGGGVLLVAVATPCLLALVAFWPHSWPGLAVAPFDRAFVLALTLAALPVALVGWLDDVAEVRPSIRLAVHLAAVAVAVALLPPLFDFMPLYVEKIVLVLAWGWFVNLVNFMNGADGLVETQVVWASVGLVLLEPQLAPVALVLAGVTLGFLRVNWHPAKVFLGDVGSTWLGFMLGGLLLAGVVDNTWYSMWPLAVLVLPLCLDATSTLVRRIAGGYPVWQPHKTFWFHRILALGWRHDELVWGLLGLNVLLALFILAEVHSGVRGLSLALGLALGGLVMYTVRYTENSRKPHRS
jgi:UDP-N-acetylmuramyl pentapeptide phosphotransferase/UDP-N-acetylglucosamine-1-phosphate transferase